MAEPGAGPRLEPIGDALPADAASPRIGSRAGIDATVTMRVLNPRRRA
jgi:hypothetical protein